MAKEEEIPQRIEVGWESRDRHSMRSFERKPLHPAIRVLVRILHALALAIPMALALMFVADVADSSLAAEIKKDASVSPFDVYLLFYAVSVIAILLFKFIYYRWKRSPEREPLP